MFAAFACCCGAPLLSIAKGRLMPGVKRRPIYSAFPSLAPTIAAAAICNAVTHAHAVGAGEEEARSVSGRTFSLLALVLSSGWMAAKAVRSTRPVGQM